MCASSDTARPPSAQPCRPVNGSLPPSPRNLTTTSAPRPSNPWRRLAPAPARHRPAEAAPGTGHNRNLAGEGKHRHDLSPQRIEIVKYDIRPLLACAHRPASAASSVGRIITRENCRLAETVPLVRHRSGMVSYVGFGTDRRRHCLTQTLLRAQGTD
jgi:hypothetical protein